MVQEDSSATRDIQTLERRYAALLEQRIEDLEAQLRNAKRTEAPWGRPGPGPEIPSAYRKPRAASADRALSLPVTPSFVRVRRRVIGHDGLADEFDCDPSAQETLDPNHGTDDLEDGEMPSILTWTTIQSEKTQYRSSEFTVNRPELNALLRVALAGYPNLHFPPLTSASSSIPPIKFESPFAPLVHNYDRLEELASEEGLECDSSPFFAKLKQNVAKRSDKDPSKINYDYLSKGDNFKNASSQLWHMLSHMKANRELADLFNALKTHKQTKSIEFDYLWTIFPPGETIIGKLFLDQPQLFIVKDSAPTSVRFDTTDAEEQRRAMRPDANLPKPWFMVAWGYDWNGYTFQRVPFRFGVSPFPGSRAVNSLGFYPLEFHGADGPAETVSSLKTLLLERGRRFRQLCIAPKGSQMFDYNGDALYHGALSEGLDNDRSEKDTNFPEWLLGSLRASDPSRMAGPPKPKRTVRGRVMVDFQAFNTNSPTQGYPMGRAAISMKNDECYCLSCTANPDLRENQRRHFDRWDPALEFEDEQYILCPPRVLGYHLESKTWVELNIAKRGGDDVPPGSPGPAGSEGSKGDQYLTDIETLKDSKAFDKLQLTESMKSLIGDLVQGHSVTEPLMSDINQGKGQGLVILLHGPPGVGKTLTAESIAKLAGKPLLNVGVADVGLDPEDVEENLEKVFMLAADWHAILLFDEADVFLESRSGHTSDLSRNTMVSVLLQTLERYNGILILTTNRLREFDVAVMSRVNLGIKYEDLDREQKYEIFNNFIQQIPADKVRERENILKWFKHDEEAREYFKQLNGRQIRNILFSAATLASKKGDPLNVDHVKRLTKSMNLFNDGVRAFVEDARRKAEVGTKFL